MAGKIAMGQKDLLRSKEMELVRQKKQTLKAAGVKLKVSYRQAKRIYAAYLRGSDAALIHGNTGKQSNHKIKAEIRESVLQAYRERYDDFGPTFAAEKLAEVEGITVSVSTLRQWLLAADVWSRQRQSSAYRSQRERRGSFGELIQFDGSHHRWFEGRGLKCCLITLIRRCDEYAAFAVFRGGDDCGRDDGIIIMDKAIWHSASALLRQEERFCADPRAYGCRAFEGHNQAVKPFRESLREAGHRRDSRH